ncbi:guanine nucleotide exchange factor for Rab-3A-like [Lytechinus pictus]|uniref:guanine nucleotide exchange factor for Rab-3A-like n=1 Tax=Lytechinus pictus TaxID=7653 RepID=UPI0030BA1313
MDSTTHQFLVPHLDQQTPRSSSDPGPLNKIGEPEAQSRSRSREESVSEFDNDGTSSNCNDKTESDLDGELDELTIRIDPPDLLPGQRSRLDSLVSKNCSVAEAQAQAFLKLQEELMKAKETLQLKDEEVEQLSRVREEVDREITELTASLFEEANAMVQEANIKRAAAERRLKEANGKIDALQAEIGALKMLVLTSTPSMPVPKDATQKKPSLLRKSKSSLRLSIQGHHRTHSLQGPITADCGISPTANGTSPITNDAKTPSPSSESKEVDTLLLHNFQSWREAPSLGVDNPFTQRVFTEDIQPCLSFTNADLSVQLQSSIERNQLCIEPISIKTTVPRRCALSEQQRPCHYRIKLSESENSWHSICAPVRNRIAAVCDFYTYLRYIKQGIVKNDVEKNYWEIIRLRKQMGLAKLGLA